MEKADFFGKNQVNPNNQENPSLDGYYNVGALEFEEKGQFVILNEAQRNEESILIITLAIVEIRRGFHGFFHFDKLSVRMTKKVL